MKTIEKRSFPKLENEFLENILRQLVDQHNIVQMFFTKQELSLSAHLVIILEKKADADQLKLAKWVKKVKNRCQIEVYFMYSGRLHHRFSLGHPFIELYCRPSALIYQNKESGNPLIITRNWKKYKKKFQEYQDRFYHDHDLHKSQVNSLISEGASTSVFTSYARLIEYDLEYLEELYSANNCNSLCLEESINKLTEYIPEIQKYFVKSSSTKYYLTDLFAKAKRALADDDTFYEDEMCEAITIAEQNLYRLIVERFAELKMQIKKECFKKREVSSEDTSKPKDEILDTTIETILNSAAVEQIYMYHQITYGEKTTYYLMLIANSVGNEKLRSLTQSLKSKMGVKYDFVLLSHSRLWIQQNLYCYQGFFAGILQNKKPIYSSSQYHPELHWEVPHEPCHADLHFHYRAAKNTAFQFFEIANKDNYQGVGNLFSLFFLSFCRTYIFVKRYYLPNYLSSQALWELCIYADPDIRKYNYLIEQFWTDFFPYLDEHRVFHHKLSNLNKEKVAQMNIIVEKLVYELYDLVIERGLLADSRQE